MPTAVQITGALIPPGGAFGPIEYGSTLYVIALTTLAEEQDENSVLGIFRSLDGGETWSQTGSTITIPSAEEVGGIHGSIATGDPEYLHGCFDVDYPTEPYTYIAHSGLSGGVGCVFVTRFDASAGDFDTTSAAGPEIPIAGSLGNHDFLGWMIAQSSERDFGVLANLNSSGSDINLVYAMSLSEDLGSWSSRAVVPGQADGAFSAAGIVRGAGGRVHGLIEKQGYGLEDSDFTVYHTVVIGGGGGVGGALQVITTMTDNESIITGPKIFESPYTGGYLSGEVLFVFALPPEGIGAEYNLVAAHGGSEDEPIWDILSIDETANAENSYWAGVGSSASTVEVAFNINNTFDSVMVSSYDGSEWGAAVEATDGVGPFWIVCNRIAAGLGITFGNGDYDVYFVILGGGGATIVGSAGIPSEEAFGKTHGIFGGGGDGETCGTAVPVPSEESCNSIPVDNRYPGDQDSCPTAGYSY